MKGQRYVGPGREKMDNLGELTVKVRIEQHGAGDISSRVSLQGAKVRKPLLAVSGVIDKGNIVVCAGVASVRNHVTGVQGRIPLHANNGLFILRTWRGRRNLKKLRRRISVGGEPPGCVSLDHP